MEFRPNNGSLHRILAVAAVFLAAVSWLHADAIIFSKPAVPLAAPPRVDEGLPKVRVDEEMDFAPVTPMDARPPISAPQIMETNPQRSRDADDDSNEHWLLRDPYKIRDPLGKNPLKEQTKQDPIRAPWQVQAMKKREKDDIRSLTPVKEFDWDENNPDKQKNGLLSEWRREQQGLTRDQKDEQFNPFQPRKDRKEERRDPLQPPMNFESIGNRTYEKPTMAQLERRAAFEQLLNPTPPQNVKQQSSLEPVVAMDIPKPITPAPRAPVNSTIATHLDRGPVDPIVKLREDQHRLYGAGAIENPDEKYAVQPKSFAPKVAEPIYKTPLLQQPLRREIPSRQF